MFSSEPQLRKLSASIKEQTIFDSILSANLIYYTMCIGSFPTSWKLMNFGYEFFIYQYMQVRSNTVWFLLFYRATTNPV